jgi:DNA-binding NtrC family response regulator
MSTQGLARTAEGGGVITALAVSALEADREALRQIFGDSGWRLGLCSTIGQARRHLSREVFSVVICATALPDGAWTLLFQDTDALPSPPRFIVCSRLADERLWSEVLNVGGYDVLSTPFDAREVSHVVRCA